MTKGGSKVTIHRIEKQLKKCAYEALRSAVSSDSNPDKKIIRLAGPVDGFDRGMAARCPGGVVTRDY
jgi:hypothetical protein